MLNRAIKMVAILSVGFCLGDLDARELAKPDRVLFRAGDNPDRADPDHDESEWVEIPESALSEGWRGASSGAFRGGRIGWYRLHFSEIPESRDIAWMISAGFLGNLSQAYWDGRPLGGIGIEKKGLTIPPPQRTLHVWPLTSKMLEPNDRGEHVLAIRVRRVAGAGGMIGGPVGLMPATDQLREKARVELGREVIVSLVSAFAITWGLIFALVRFIGDRSQPWMFAAGLFVCSGGVHLMSSQLLASSASGSALTLVVFVAIIVYWGVPMLSPWLIRGCCGGKGIWKEVVVTVAGVCLMILAQVMREEVFKVVLCYATLLILAGVVALLRVMEGWKFRRSEVVPVLVGLLGLVLAAGAQISLFWIPWMKLAASVWQPMDFGILATVGSVGSSLLFRYAALRKREQRYARLVLEGQRLERARIGRHLHDGVAQDLQYVMFAAKQWASESPSNPQAEIVVDGIGTAIREVRRSAEDLLPLALKSGTLKEALEALVRRLNERHDCEVTLKWGALPEMLDSEEEALFRAASEAALNACRHAQAGSVRIEVENIRGVAGVRVIDDGRGFDPDGLSSERLGLRFLRDQAELSGGNLNIESRRGEGTTIAFRLPRHDPAGPDSTK